MAAGGQVGRQGGNGHSHRASTGARGATGWLAAGGRQQGTASGGGGGGTGGEPRQGAPITREHPTSARTERAAPPPPQGEKRDLGERDTKARLQQRRRGGRHAIPVPPSDANARRCRKGGTCPVRLLTVLVGGTGPGSEWTARPAAATGPLRTAANAAVAVEAVTSTGSECNACVRGVWREAVATSADHKRRQVSDGSTYLHKSDNYRTDRTCTGKPSRIKSISTRLVDSSCTTLTLTCSCAPPCTLLFVHHLPPLPSSAPAPQATLTNSSRGTPSFHVSISAWSV